MIRVRPLASLFPEMYARWLRRLALGLNALLQRRGPRILFYELVAQIAPRADPPFPLYAYKGKAEAMASLREPKKDITLDMDSF